MKCTPCRCHLSCAELGDPLSTTHTCTAGRLHVCSMICARLRCPHACRSPRISHSPPGCVQTLGPTCEIPRIPPQYVQARGLHAPPPRVQAQDPRAPPPCASSVSPAHVHVERGCGGGGRFRDRLPGPVPGRPRRAAPQRSPPPPPDATPMSPSGPAGCGTAPGRHRAPAIPPRWYGCAGAPKGRWGGCRGGCQPGMSGPVSPPVPYRAHGADAARAPRDLPPHPPLSLGDWKRVFQLRGCSALLRADSWQVCPQSCANPVPTVPDVIFFHNLCY